MESDLDSELVHLDDLVDRVVTVVDKPTARRIGKSAGKYVTLASRAVVGGRVDAYSRLSTAIGDCIAEMVGKHGSVLVVGLGNASLTADSLGARVVSDVTVTRGMGVGCREVSTFTPSVRGLTGIDSYDAVKGIVERVRPSVVIAVDSLAAASVDRLATAFQVCSAGITPGSGVGGNARRLDYQSLGCKVISVGVPLIVYASTIVDECGGEINRDNQSDVIGLIVTPKDIDYLVGECAQIIARAIDYALIG